MNTLTVTNQNMAPPSISGTANNNKTAKTDSIKAEGRTSALQAIYDAHVEQIYRFIFFKVGNREDAEDITSHVFIKAAHSLDVSQAAHTQLAWLYQVARTTITDHWRNYYKGVTSSLEAMEEESPLHLTADPIFAGAPDDESLDPAIEKVRKVLSILPENYRRVLELRFLKGCTLRETAAALQITEANAKVIQHRAIQKALKMGAELI